MSPPRFISTLASLAVIAPVALFANAAATSASAPASLTPTRIGQLSQNANQKVIVILRNQHRNLGGRVHAADRKTAIATDQKPVLDELSAVKAGNVQAFHVINAIAATVSKAEAAHLRGNASVQAVVPDRVIRELPTRDTTDAATAASAVAPKVVPANLCSTNPAAPMQNENLTLTNDTAATQMQTPQGQSIDGTGVKVGFIADNLDPANADFLRPGSGAPVITDFEDFTGDGATYYGGGDEAFGDAGTIAAQGNTVYDLKNYSYLQTNHCYVTSNGLAPGVTIEALNVFSSQGYWSTSATFVRAIQYAVDTNVDVLNESFGKNNYPNFGAADDPVALADQAATDDGVVVSVSSGDAGTTGTLGSPSTLQNVIEAGATTDLRSEQQVNYPGTGLGTGWLSNEISPFSSGGTSQNGQRTVDVVAPGNSDWVPCDPPSCKDFSSLAGAPTNVELFGGTSEAAPIVSAISALVIQAYRSTHAGANPTPAEVKTILKSSATNLNYPSDEQGAGLVNAQKAVQVALSLPDANGTPHPAGPGFIAEGLPGSTDPSSTLFAQDVPNTPEHFSVQVTNTGTTTEVFKVSALKLGPLTTSNFSIPSYPAGWGTFTDTFGRTLHDYNQAFTVPAGKQYMQVALAWDTIAHPGSRVRVTLYDPSGREAMYSRPQGPAPGVNGQGWGNMEIHNPQAGVWHAIVWASSTFSDSAPTKLAVQVGSYVPAGTVTLPAFPATAGKSVTFSVNLKTPSTPGDEPVNLLVTGIQGTTPFQSSVIPVILRSYLNPAGGSTTWSGLISGGNGRPGAPGDTKAFGFRVPTGTHDISLGVTLADNGYNLEGVLVDPNGNPMDVQTTATGQDSSGNITNISKTLQFFWANPKPGLWTYIQFVNGFGGGGQVFEPYSGNLQFNAVKVTLTGMPTGPVTPGSTFTGHVNITNTGNEPESFFVDPRKSAPNQTTYLGGPYADGINYSYGYPFAPYAYFLSPTDTSQIAVWGQLINGTTPFDLEIQGADGQAPYGSTGVPDADSGSPVFNPVTGYWENTVTLGNGSDTSLPGGFYYTAASETGPFGSAGAASGDPSDLVLLASEVTTRTFDTPNSQNTSNNACPANGDLWAQQMGQQDSTCNSGNYTEITVNPGDSTTIDVTFKAPATLGTTVTGQLDTDTMLISYSSTGTTIMPGPATSAIFATGSSDILAQIPYSYTTLSAP